MNVPPQSSRSRRQKPLRVLITGGPTRAYLDRVRFLSNVSTGALAYLICQELLRQGFKVAAVIGPTSLPFEKLSLTHYKAVETNEQMHEETLRLCRTFHPDVAIFSAAVLDFAPVKPRQGKVSSSTGWTLRLKPTRKILDEVGRRFPSVARVGFKLEWQEPSRKRALQYGKKILKRKKLQLLVLNYLSQLHERKHPAYLFRADSEKITRAQNKSQIARWISEQIHQL